MRNSTGFCAWSNSLQFFCALSTFYGLLWYVFTSKREKHKFYQGFPKITPWNNHIFRLMSPRLILKHLVWKSTEGFKQNCITELFSSCFPQVWCENAVRHQRKSAWDFRFQLCAVLFLSLSPPFCRNVINLYVQSTIIFFSWKRPIKLPLYTKSPFWWPTYTVINWISAALPSSLHLSYWAIVIYCPLLGCWGSRRNVCHTILDAVRPNW